MQRKMHAVRWLVNLLTIAWFPAVMLLVFHAPVMAQSVDVNGEAGGTLHISVGAVYALAGILAVVAPAIWWAGRYDSRVSTVEREMERIAKHLDGIATRSANAGERIAMAVESIARHKADE